MIAINTGMLQADQRLVKFEIRHRFELFEELFDARKCVGYLFVKQALFSTSKRKIKLMFRNINTEIKGKFHRFTIANRADRSTRFKHHQVLANESANSNFYLMPKLKTSGGGLYPEIGLKPGRLTKSPPPLLTYPHLWKTVKEKRSKKEKLYNNGYSLNYPIGQT